MLIITDCKEYTEEAFAVTPGWQNIIESSAPPVVKDINSKLFHTDNLFITDIETDSLWKYAFIVNHSSSSQFNSLIELSERQAGLPGSILCLARSGDNFTGYKNRRWVSLPGNIHLSAYLKPNQDVDHYHTGFTILSAISVIETLDKIPDLKNKASIKWVNDIFVEDRKIAGVLTQTQTKGKKVTDLFIGIGLNVIKEPLLQGDLVANKATSIRKHIKDIEQVGLSYVLKNLLLSLSSNYKFLLEGNYNLILDTYIKRSGILGKKVAVYSDPPSGEPQKVNEGKVIFIGENLELYLENKKTPIVRGRIVF
jgi:BirA family biotin operon repressor/biotin-[acetyl-CoA-carboxylase] ligase